MTVSPPNPQPYGQPHRPTPPEATAAQPGWPMPPQASAPQPPPVKGRRVGRWILIGVIVVMLLGLVSCLAAVLSSSDNSGTTARPAASGATSPSAPGEEPTEVDEPDDEETPDLPVFVEGKFGDRGIYKDGISVSILSAEMEEGDDGSYVVVKAKIKNGTKKTFDPSDANVSVAYGKQATPTEPIEVAHKTHTSFGSKIAAHKSKTAKFGFLLTKKQAKDIQVTITPDVERYRPLAFKGSAK